MWMRHTLEMVGSAAICVGLIGQPQIGVPIATENSLSLPAIVIPALPALPALPARPVPKRPASLVPLYVSFATLQLLDIHSTLRAPSFGAREANPVIGGIVGSPPALVAAKAGMAAGVCVMSERLWKHNRAAAVATMVALNAAYGALVAHNYALEARAGRTASR